MRFYVASSSDDEGMRQTRELIAKAQEAGHECTCDWTVIVERERPPFASADFIVPNAVLFRSAELDRQGIRDAEAFIYLQPTKKSEGAAWELGYAHGLCECSDYEPVVLIVSQAPTCLFTRLEDDWVTTIDEAVAWLTALEPATETEPLRAAGHLAKVMRE